MALRSVPRTRADGCCWAKTAFLDYRELHGAASRYLPNSMAQIPVPSRILEKDNVRADVETTSCKIKDILRIGIDRC